MQEIGGKWFKPLPSQDLVQPTKIEITDWQCIWRARASLDCMNVDGSLQEEIGRTRDAQKWIVHRT